MTRKDSENLPAHNVKSLEDVDDLEAAKRIDVILDSPGYRQADQDVDFLNEDGTRGVRLQIDYQKAETILKQAGVNHSIVVFGSARLQSHNLAQKTLKEAEAALEKDPDNIELQQELAVALRALKDSKYYEEAREFGRLVGNSGSGPHDTRLTLFTGGGPGLMEAANRGAYDVDAKSVGLNITLPYPQCPNSYITPELCFRFHYFAMRKLHFVKRAKALVAFPGGYGTLDELFGLLTLVQTKKVDEVPIVLVGSDYWNRVIDFDFLIEGGFISAGDRELFAITDSAKDAWGYILRWYDEKGEPLINHTS